MNILLERLNGFAGFFSGVRGHVMALVALLLITSGSVTAAQLATFLEGLDSMSAEFSQRVYDNQGALVEESAGSVAMQFPRHFRWDYREPYPQLIVADGSQVWFFDPDLEQVTVQQQGEAGSEVLLQILVDPQNLERTFKVFDQGMEKTRHWMRLEPLDDSQPFAQIRLALESGLVTQLEFEDRLGQFTVLTFEQIAKNPELSPSLFQFSPPEGVDIFEPAAR